MSPCTRLPNCMMQSLLVHSERAVGLCAELPFRIGARGRYPAVPLWGTLGLCSQLHSVL